MKPRKSLESALNELKAWEFKTTLSSRPFSFRASSLPYCPMALAISMAREQVPNKMDFGGDLYMSVGTTIHEVYQRWLGKFYGSRNLFGLWTCDKCKREIGPGFRPDSCACGGQFTYKELRVVHGDFSGHCDGVWFDGVDWYLLDIKSTGWRTYKALNTFEDILEKHPYWMHQLGAYANILERDGFVPQAFTKVLVLLVDRADPKTRWKILEVPAYRDEFEDALELYSEISAQLAAGDVDNIYRNCDSYHEGKYCDFQAVCFSKDFGFWMDRWLGRRSR